MIGDQMFDFSYPTTIVYNTNNPIYAQTELQKKAKMQKSQINIEAVEYYSIVIPSTVTFIGKNNI